MLPGRSRIIRSLEVGVQEVLNSFFLISFILSLSRLLLASTNGAHPMDSGIDMLMATLSNV